MKQREREREREAGVGGWGGGGWFETDWKAERQADELIDPTDEEVDEPP